MQMNNLTLKIYENKQKGRKITVTYKKTVKKFKIRNFSN